MRTLGGISQEYKNLEGSLHERDKHLGRGKQSALIKLGRTTPVILLTIWLMTPKKPTPGIFSRKAASFPRIQNRPINFLKATLLLSLPKTRNLRYLTFTKHTRWPIRSTRNISARKIASPILSPAWRAIHRGFSRGSRGYSVRSTPMYGLPVITWALETCQKKIRRL